MSAIFINGRFLTRKITGVERFARMILTQWDATPDAADCFRLLVPPGTPRADFPRRIPTRVVGWCGGHLWEQGALAWASRGGALANLCNSGPVTHRRSLVVLHDALVYRHPDHFSQSYRLLHQRLGRRLARRAQLATVSHFSQVELAAVLGLPPSRIPVVPNAADHIDAITPDAGALGRFGLERQPFLLMVGSFAPNKNMPAAIAAFEAVARDNERLVIVGAGARSFANDAVHSMSDRVLLTGRVDDAVLVALLAGARALVFPSLYEGFGIPPLEAMRLGTPVVASDIASVRETCEDAALYVNPRDLIAIGHAMRQVLDHDDVHSLLTERALIRGRLFSWAASSKALRQLLCRL